MHFAHMALFPPKPCEVVFILSLGKDKGYSYLCIEIKKRMWTIKSR